MKKIVKNVAFITVIVGLILIMQKNCIIYADTFSGTKPAAGNTEMFKDTKKHRTNQDSQAKNGSNNDVANTTTDNNDDDFWGAASNWYSQGGVNAVGLPKNAMQNLANMINIAGTAVISIVTVILGIKYMIGGVSGKTEVKQQLISLLVACMLFFGWSSMSKLLIKGTTYDSTTGTYTTVNSNTKLFIFENANTIEQIFAKVFGIVVFFGHIVAIVAIMIMGAKYIFSGADGKANLKQKGPMFIIGILMIFCTLNILSFISTIINEALLV